MLAIADLWVNRIGSIWFHENFPEFNMNNICSVFQIPERRGVWSTCVMEVHVFMES